MTELQVKYEELLAAISLAHLPSNNDTAKCSHHIDEESSIFGACSTRLGKTAKWNGIDTPVTFLPECLPRLHVKPELIHFAQTNIYRSTRDEPSINDILRRRSSVANIPDNGVESVRRVLQML
jgi:hypothetical protein